MNIFKKVALSTLTLGLIATPFYLKASESTTLEQPIPASFSQTESINQTVHELESLFVLMQERLALMHDVARYKWNSNQQNQTLDAEQLLLGVKGLENDAFVSSFFEAQNEASTQLQNQDFELFEAEKVGKFEDVKDFETEILPKLKAINEEMLSTVNELLVHTQNESLPEFLKDISFSSFQNEGITRDIYDIAVNPLFTD